MAEGFIVRNPDGKFLTGKYRWTQKKKGVGHPEWKGAWVHTLAILRSRRRQIGDACSIIPATFDHQTKTVKLQREKEILSARQFFRARP